MEPRNIHVEVSTTTIVRFILIILLFVFIYVLKDVVMVFFFALIIASAISPFANWLDEKGFPRILGVLMLYLVVFGLAVFVLSMIVPVISSDISLLTSNIPKVIDKFNISLDDVQGSVPRYLDFLGEIQNILEITSVYLQQSAQSVFSLVISIFGGIFSFIAIIVISFYLAVMKKGIESLIQAVSPGDHEAYMIDLWKRAEGKVGRWLQGQLLLALVVGLVVYIGLSLMGIKYALLWGILAMVLEIVPVVGPVLAAVPPVIFGFLDSPSLGLWTVVFYLLIQQLENHVLVPIVVGKTTGLNPVVVIVALLVGANLAGIPGMLLSVPVATIIVEIIDDLAKSKLARKQSIT